MKSAVAAHHRRARARSALVESLERRALFSVTIISDAFTDGPAYSSSNLAGRSPTLLDLPGGQYQTASGYSYDQQVLGTNNGTYSSTAYFHNTGSVAIGLASAGSYAKPAGLQVSGTIAFELSPGVVSDAYLGFYSAVRAGFNSNALLNFTGLRLSTTGDLTLISKGQVGQTIAYTGSYTPGNFVTLTYDVNTITGAIFGVTLGGAVGASSSDYSTFTTTAFTATGTTFGGFGGDNDPVGRVHFSNFEIDSVAVPPPAPAAKLAFRQAPVSNFVNTTLAPSVSVDVEDASGKLVTTDTSMVTLSIATGTDALVGKTSVAAVGGIATFLNLSLPTAGTFTLRASDALLASTVSTPFTIASSGGTLPADGGLTDTNPFGVASSFNSTATYSTWAPKAAQAGATWVRLFPQWNQIEPSNGVFDWTSVDAVTNTAAANGQNVSGILYYGSSWATGDDGALPTANLPAWSQYVSALVARERGKVEHWEVWNEPQNASNGGSPQAYADTVVAAYDAAKAVDPNAQIGLDIASVDVNYLEQVIQDGAANHFDFVTVHPYEVLGAVDQGWEGDFLSIVPTLRRMLAANNPAKVNAPIWFSEMGEEIGSTNGPQIVTAASQAQDLIKAYSLGLAEGVARMDWYQAQDFGGGDAGFGLLDANGNATPSYTAYQTLTSALGGAPKYQGWLQLNGVDDAFVFQGATTTVMAAWAKPNSSDNVTFAADVQVIDPSTGITTTLVAGSTLTLTSAPLLIVGVPANLLAHAQANKTKPFSWGGDFSTASSVSTQLGETNLDAGLHQLNGDQTSKAATVDGGPARLVNDSNGDVYQSFEVDPNFVSYQASPIYITVVARRDANNDPAAFDIGYESTTGMQQGTASGRWTIPGNDKWYSHTFAITDAEFDSKWAYNFFINGGSPSDGAFYAQSVSVSRPASPVIVKLVGTVRLSSVKGATIA